jgi:hypothetical protein
MTSPVQGFGGDTADSLLFLEDIFLMSWKAPILQHIHTYFEPFLILVMGQ